jgi:hypothetical protein
MTASTAPPTAHFCHGRCTTCTEPTPDTDPADKTPHIGRTVVYGLNGNHEGDTRTAVIVDADPDRYLVDLHIPDATVTQLGVRWWTGQYRPSCLHVGFNYCWPAGLPQHQGMNQETWAGEVPDALR